MKVKLEPHEEQIFVDDDDEVSVSYMYLRDIQPFLFYYFGGARSKGFATLRNVPKLPFFAKIGHAESVGFRIYSVIWRSESRISSRYL